VVRDAPGATDAQLERFHTPQHVAKVFAACAKAEDKSSRLVTQLGGETAVAADKKKRRQLEQCSVALDGDTSVMAGTAEAARRACGAACAAVEAVCEGRASSAFCAVRRSLTPNPDEARQTRP
jgi:acetoin utilization deacetylase AcuC-like enzyme